MSAIGEAARVLGGKVIEYQLVEGRAHLRLPRERHPRKDPRHDTIARAQPGLLAALGITPQVAHRTCWACGAQSMPGEPNGWLERAHIVAHADGGSNDPTNYFLLCCICHSEQPDGEPRGVQFDWLRRHKRLGGLSAPKYRSERIKNGIAQAKREGRIPGRPPSLSPERSEQARKLRGEGKTWSQIGEALGVSMWTAMRAAAKAA